MPNTSDEAKRSAKTASDSPLAVPVVADIKDTSEPYAAPSTAVPSMQVQPSSANRPIQPRSTPHDDAADSDDDDLFRNTNRQGGRGMPASDSEDEADSDADHGD